MSASRTSPPNPPLVCPGWFRGQALEKEVRAEVAAGVKAAKAGKQPDLKERDTEILWGEPPPFIRGVEYESSVFHNSKY